MKHCILIIGLIFLLCKTSNGQESDDFLVDEFLISVNKTNVQSVNTEDRVGFGLGVYHSFMEDKKLNLIMGLEYNRTSQFKKSMYEGHFAHATDITYRLNCISIPVGFRLYVGSKLKVFIESGGFADIVLYSNRTGTLHTYSPTGTMQSLYLETEIDENAKLSNSVGLYVGLGARIPIAKYELIIKPDYKFAVNKLYSYQDDIFNRYFRINIGLKI